MVDGGGDGLSEAQSAHLVADHLGIYASFGQGSMVATKFLPSPITHEVRRM